MANKNNGYQIKAAASRLRKDADALLVLVITANEVVYSADPDLTPRDLEQALHDEAAAVANYHRLDLNKKARA